MKWYESFSLFMDYELFLIKSNVEPLVCAHRLGKALRRDFSFLCDCPVAYKDKQVLFPIFFANWDSLLNARAVLIPNKMMVEVPTEERHLDPLLGLSLFDVDTTDFFFLYNKKMRNRTEPLFAIKDYVDYDYILVLSSDKGTGSIQEMMELLHDHYLGECRPANDILFANPEKKDSKGQLFMKNLLSDVDVSISKYKAEYVERRLHGRVKVTEANHGMRNIQIDRPVSLIELFDSPLLCREDI